jgi:hypothetical protein
MSSIPLPLLRGLLLRWISISQLSSKLLCLLVKSTTKMINLKLLRALLNSVIPATPILTLNAYTFYSLKADNTEVKAKLQEVNIKLYGLESNIQSAKNISSQCLAYCNAYTGVRN